MDADYTHAKRIWKDIEIKKNRLITWFVSWFVVDVFEKFRQMCLKS